jgi:hypothetical protein
MISEQSKRLRSQNKILEFFAGQFGNLKRAKQEGLNKESLKIALLPSKIRYHSICHGLL